MLLLGSIISIAQPVTQRGTTSVTVQDARLFAQYNFRPPVFPDTTSANTQIGLDSCGALIYSRDINAYYYRACSPKRWVRVSPGGSVSDSAYFSYRPLTDSTFLLCRVGGTRCDTIKVNGKGVSTAWLIGGNVNPIPPYIGTIDTKELDIITNNVVRMRVAGNGINRSSAARNKFLTMDTTTRYLYYTDGGGGIDTIPSLQDVLTAGNTSIGKEMYVLDTINNKGFNFYTQGNPNSINYGPELYIDAKGFNNYGIGLQSGLGDAFSYGKIKFYNGDDGDKTLQFPNSSTGSTIIDLPSYSVNTTGEDTLATLADIRNSAIDTSNKFVNNIYRTSGIDSIYYKIGSTTYAIKDSAGGQNGRFGNDTATIVMAKVHNDAGVILTNGKVVSFSTSGTNSNAPSVRLANNKADSTSANTIGFVSGTIAVNDTGWVILSGHIDKLNTSAFSNGDIIYLDSISGQWTKSKPKAPYHMVYLGVIVKSNAGNGSIFVKCQNGYEADEIHDFQITSPTNNQILVYSDTQKVWKNRSIYSVVDTTNKIATKTDLALKLNISDTATMLSKYLRKTDTASLSNRIDLRVKYTDTATMLTPYLRKIDTTSLSNRINLKVNIADTATMLSPYLRSNTASATYLAKSDSTTYYTKYRSDTSRTNIYNALFGKQGTLTLTTTGTSGASTLVGNTLNIPQYSGGTSYTFSTGLTNSSGTVTNNLSTGVAGGQSVVGGTAASNSLTLSSTSNATKGKILFGTSAYDEVNNRLGIGTASPTTPLDIIRNDAGAINSLVIRNTSTTGANAILLGQDASTNNLGFGWFGSGNAAFRALNPKTAYMYALSGAYGLGFSTTTTTQPIFFCTDDWTERMRITGGGNLLINTSTDAGYKLDVNGTARVQGDITSTGVVKSISGNTTAQFNAYIPASTFPRAQFQIGESSSDNNIGLTIAPLYSSSGVQKTAFLQISTNKNTTDAGQYAGTLLCSTTEFTINTARQDGQVAGGVPMVFSPNATEAMRLQSNGNIKFPATNTASGTTGNQTINKTSGTVNIAAAGTTVTVTNSLVTASSIVFAVIRTNDATATIKNVVPAAGSFTINLGSATTAETSIGFFVIN